MKTFKELGIAEPILKAIEEEKFEKPSEIQEKAIPLVLEGKDVIAGSATGSGKTLVFGSVIIAECRKGSGIQALILTPTRELAEQNTRALRKFSKHKPLEIVDVYGGLSITPQIDKLRRADIVIATPGRLLDHIQRKTIDLTKLKILVLDEADRMFDMGFKYDVERIIRQCPLKRQTMLFSATISEDVFHVAKRHMKNPIQVAAESYVDPKKLRQYYYDIDEQTKFSLLVHLLKKDPAALVMLFCNTRRTVDFVANNLNANSISAQAIHGGFTQGRRSTVLDQFRLQKIKVLVCTDVAARGLDIKDVSHVYNYDIPIESKNYIHRIGRTARAGKEGEAISLLTRNQHNDFRAVMRDNDVTITKLETPAVENVIVRRAERPSFNRRFGGRPSGPAHRGGMRGGGKRKNWVGPRTRSRW